LHLNCKSRWLLPKDHKTSILVQTEPCGGFRHINLCCNELFTIFLSQYNFNITAFVTKPDTDYSYHPLASLRSSNHSCDFKLLRSPGTMDHSEVDFGSWISEEDWASGIDNQEEAEESTAAIPSLDNKNSTRGISTSNKAFK
jgi:hypothetical protein